MSPKDRSLRPTKCWTANSGGIGVRSGVTEQGTTCGFGHCLKKARRRASETPFQDLPDSRRFTDPHAKQLKSAANWQNPSESQSRRCFGIVLALKQIRNGRLGTSKRVEKCLRKIEMSHTALNESRGLAPSTQVRIREVFAGRTCCRCGVPAVRLCADRFFCLDHYRDRERKRPKVPRVLRITGWDSEGSTDAW